MKIGVEYFQRQLLQLEPIEFLGVVNMLGLPLFLEGEEKAPIPFEELFAAVIEKYQRMSRRRRKNLHKILEAAITESNDQGQ